MYSQVPDAATHKQSVDSYINLTVLISALPKVSAGNQSTNRINGMADGDGASASAFTDGASRRMHAEHGPHILQQKLECSAVR